MRMVSSTLLVFVMLISLPLLGVSAPQDGAKAAAKKQVAGPPLPSTTSVAPEAPVKKKTSPRITIPLPANQQALVGDEMQLFSARGEVVSLLENSPNRPTLPRLVGKLVYFTSQVDSKECLGRNLFKVTPKDKVDRKILSVECVLGLYTDGKELAVHYKEKNTIKLAFLKMEPAAEDGGEPTAKLVDIRDTESLGRAFKDRKAVINVNRIKLSMRLNDPSLEPGDSDEDPDWLRLFWGTNNPNFKGTSQLAYCFEGGGKTKCIIAGSATLKARDRPNPPSFSQVTGLPDEFDKTPFEMIQNQNGYFVLSGNFPHSDMGKIMVLNPEDGKVLATLGAEIPLIQIWEGTDATEFAIHLPKYLEPTPGGFLIADRTITPGELESIVYYSFAEARFYRLLFPSRDVGGFQFVNQGLLIAKPRTGAIRWRGDLANFTDASLWQNQPLADAADAAADGGEPAKKTAAGADYSVRNCGTYQVAREATGGYSISVIDDNETVLLANIEGLQSLACVENSIGYVALKTKMVLMQKHLGLRFQVEDELKGIEDATNIQSLKKLVDGSVELHELTQNDTIIEDPTEEKEKKKALFFLIKNNSLVLIRRPYSGINFRHVRPNHPDFPAGFELWLDNETQAPFTTFIRTVDADGSEWSVTDHDEKRRPSPSIEYFEAQ